ncbi:hypothetical protein NMY22_g1663 [Coprinellus aureogranulatus]|nr:hypothetical protein NMY22_g1663 [Coprinellus aureogranulatus]
MGVEHENPEQKSIYQRLEELSANFISSASSVQELSERFEYVLKSYILPAFAYAEASFERKPIATVRFAPSSAARLIANIISPALKVFVLVFLALSVVPFLTYAVTCCAALSTYLFLALLTVLTVSIGTLLTLTTILLSVLFGIAIAATFITATIVSSYLVLRLAILVRQEGIVAGAALWVSDIRNHVLGFVSSPPSLSPSDNQRFQAPNDLATKKTTEQPVKEEPNSDVDPLRPDVAVADSFEILLMSSFFCVFYPLVSIAIIHQAVSVQLKKRSAPAYASFGCDVVLLYSLAKRPGAVLLMSSSFIPWVFASTLTASQWVTALERATVQVYSLLCPTHPWQQAIPPQLKCHSIPGRNTTNDPPRMQPTIPTPKETGGTASSGTPGVLGDEDWLLAWNPTSY